MSAPFGDYRLASYEVRCTERRLTMRAQRVFDGAPSETELRFSGLAAYHLEHDTLGSILLSVDEVPLADHLRACWQEFETGFKLAGWPLFWSPGEDVEAAIERLKAHGLRAYQVLAIGISGWVLAESFMTHETAVREP